MSWLDNFKIVVKVGLIVGILGVVMIGETLFAARRMRAMDDANTDVVTRVDKYTTLATRMTRHAEAYLSAAFQLAVETTDEGNVKYLAKTKSSEKAYKAGMSDVLNHMPEKGTAIKPILAGFEKAFVVCDPGIEYAATTTSPEENMKAAARLKAECVPLMEAAITDQVKLVDDLLADAHRISDAMTAEADSSISTVQITAAAGLLLGLAVAMWIGIAGMSRPIARLKAAMEALARNDLTAAVPGKQRRDEIGEMARSVEVFKANGLDVERLKREQQEADQQAAVRRKADMTQLADGFESAIGHIVETVSSASTELEASANTLTATAERSQQLATVVAAASGQASANVQSVSSATEELSSSVNEISRQVQESARMANDAVDQARTTNDRVSELSKAAARIGDVVELINTIAGQTNLLALNATIEAARAGDAGRGFAVVASEVKALAEQTAKATGEIGQQISGIQAATQESVGAIKEISSTIERLSEISSTIAAAVEEQGAATQEISRNVLQAAQGTQHVSANITDVQRGATETGSASSQVLSAAQSLSSDSARLKIEVGRFLGTIRAA
ncbi:methyl-accepting chemotaxis protein [Bradyrhizobium sp. 2S1]|uniref:methyl-accepting chemotaxis protein n=1 Tax=Bradyrhizobium sp. 2S1 TaxID=1404429 RepID=UPI00140B6A6C|nr:HAMP domain-containing methyl-accepting chemotaxis protein [Bradyrhizobium sp. 2S1]MCK7668653.1 methyl-accepting chemotaxis protein [Bradyrhizobium sp. 2S1]